MAESSTSIAEVWKNLQGFMILLEYAACELFLNFLLLIDALFSYLLTKFARYCKLQRPCILCSRLDHVLENEKPTFYCNLLCSNHRSEISSMFSCCIHGNLADGNSMCDECFLSFSRKSKSSSDMERLLMGKFGFDLSSHGCQSSLINGESVLDSDSVKQCSCCNKPWISRQKVDKPHLVKVKPPRSGVSVPNIPLPRRLTHRESLKKMRERFSGSTTPGRLGKLNPDPLSHVGYKELKITSDSDSEFPISDDDDGSNASVRRMKEPKEVPPITLTNYFHFNANRDHDRGQKPNQKAYPSALPELISLDDFPALSHGVVESIENSELKFHVSQNSNPSVLSQLMALVDAPSLFKRPSEISQRKSEIANIDQVANECKNQIDDLKSTIEIAAKEPEGCEEEEKFPDERVPIAHEDNGDEGQIIESGVESIDESSVSEIENEGDNIVDRLKKQIQNDKRCINALYKELEEERNASAISANHAMAMITRLQEEKASLHMEALQYLRMMEEQAEYDVDALEKANDLLAEKEKEIQDMEADLEYFSLQLLAEPALHTVPSVRVNHEENLINVKSSWKELEDEKLFLSQYLKDLETKFHNAANQDTNSEETADGESNKAETDHKKSNSTSTDGDEIGRNEKINLVNLENEISDINERLEALESDWNFVEHTLSSLQAGKEGLCLVQEIAQNLQELRKTATRGRP
ncbi:probable myosin-binding protein 4 isoform X2 [Mercurialis annua]|uniref:probable myosin-binding protein 4 isoform X2 n=1 Tax=Mercurialis annua TaxID=3986 RepID=UPI00215EB782|nr:probable myosin-binding protein 4 isoform X2 [Mercurialis annua]